MVEASNSAAIGVYVDAGINGDGFSVAGGVALRASAAGALVFGSGWNATQRLDNTSISSMWLGVQSTVPTVILKKQGTLSSDIANMGVIQQDPLSTLDIGGSVGFKYTNLNAVIGGTYNITGDEYTFRIDLADFTSTSDEYIMQLPTISASAIDRRIYYFKVTDINHNAGNHGTVLLTPEATQYVEDLDEGNGHRLGQGDPLGITSGQSITLIANAADETWWVI